jgi:8-amino-3,8-dideoxy-alpha-D-manno-octulosonate transaminase
MHASPIPAPALGISLIGREEEELVLQVLRSKTLNRYYSSDPSRPPPMVETLEKEYRALVGTRFALAVTSGTAALEVALAALGVGPGDEVIVTAWSWISCFTAIVRMGAKPVLAEIDDTLCLDPREIARLSTPRTKAVLVVHYQGVAADMDPILAAARDAGIAVIEDCAQSPGVVYRGRRGGSMGSLGTFSFQHLKTVTAGEGGMVTTSDPRLYERAVRMHDLGQMRAYHSRQAEAKELAFSGSQFRMSELTGAVALAQFRRLDQIRQRCRSLSARVMASIHDLSGLSFRRIPDPDGDSGIEIYFMLAKTRLRDEFRSALTAVGIPCAPMTGTHAQYRRPYVTSGLSHCASASPFTPGPDWPGPGYRAQDFPRTEDLISRMISIPIGVNYSDANADRIGEEICRIHAKM